MLGVLKPASCTGEVTVKCLTTPKPEAKDLLKLGCKVSDDSIFSVLLWVDCNLAADKRWSNGMCVPLRIDLVFEAGEPRRYDQVR